MRANPSPHHRALVMLRDCDPPVRRSSPRESGHVAGLRELGTNLTSSAYSTTNLPPSSRKRMGGLTNFWSRLGNRFPSWVTSGCSGSIVLHVVTAPIVALVDAAVGDVKPPLILPCCAIVLSA